jgi:hypothetical protein
VTLTITPVIERPTRRLIVALGPYVLASTVHLVIVSSFVAAQALITVGVLRGLSSERR